MAANQIEPDEQALTLRLGKLCQLAQFAQLPQQIFRINRVGLERFARGQFAGDRLPEFQHVQYDPEYSLLCRWLRRLAQPFHRRWPDRGAHHRSPAPAARPAAAKTPTPASFPKVDDNAQKSRDTDRRRILDGELSAEQKNLEQAKKDLSEQEATVLPNERMQGGAISGGKLQERIQPFKDKAALHERNIEAIQKEIAKLR